MRITGGRLLFVLSVAARSLCAANRYEVAFLPTAGSSYTEATGLNNSNQVVGVSGMASNEFFPVLWENGLLKDLSRFTFPNGQDLSFARPAAVNDAGQIIGIKAVLPNTVSWMLSNGNLAIIDGPSLYSRPLALNEHGIVVGDSRVSAEFDSISRAALFGTNAKLFDETVPLTIYSSEAIGINESGTVLSRAYIRNDFGGTDVHTHICSTTENFAQGTVLTNFSASAINDTGEIAGSALFQYAYDWPAYVNIGRKRMLSSYPYSTGRATAINNQGQMVGYIGTGRPFYWENGLGVDLRDITVNSEVLSPGDTVLPVAINEQGTIIANISNPSGSRPCLFRPVESVVTPRFQIISPDDKTVFDGEAGVPVSWSIESSTLKSLRIIAFPVKTLQMLDRYSFFSGTVQTQLVSLEASHATVTNLPAGPVGIMFELSDGLGITWISEPRFVLVSRPPVEVAARERFNGKFEIALQGQPEAVYDVEQSLDLVTWTPAQNVLEPAPRIFSISKNQNQTFFRFVKVADEGGPFEQALLLSAPAPQPFEELWLNADTISQSELIMFSSDSAAYFNNRQAAATYTFTRSGPRAVISGVYTGPDNIARSFRIEFDYDHQRDPNLGSYRGFFRAEFETANGSEILKGTFTQGGSTCC